MSNESTIPTPATPDVCTIGILVDGKEIPGRFHVLSVSVTRELNRIPSAVIQFLDGEASMSTFEASNSDLFIPGKKVEIQLGYRSQNDPVFKGIVIKNGIKIRKNGSFLTVECRDEAVKMTSGAKSRYFIDKKDSEIMEEIIGSYSLQKRGKANYACLERGYPIPFHRLGFHLVPCRSQRPGRYGNRWKSYCSSTGQRGRAGG
ncbi:MAG: hypothetical protein U0586_14845 [Candidatus Brocadiaceae bacterium]